jgi:hypothetical protein
VRETREGGGPLVGIGVLRMVERHQMLRQSPVALWVWFVQDLRQS